MFTPTKFPCQVWYVTPALNVRDATAAYKVWYVTPALNVRDATAAYKCDHRYWSKRVHCTDGKVFDMCDLFATRDEAVAEAQKKLADCEQRVARAIGRFARRKKMVASLLKGGGE